MVGVTLGDEVVGLAVGDGESGQFVFLSPSAVGQKYPYWPLQ